MVESTQRSQGAPLPPNESERLEVLRSFELLDTSPDPSFDRLTAFASQLFDAPIALISLVDETRQWFKSACGLSASETPREQAFCAYAILSDEVFVVPNALQDERFAENPLVTGPPSIRFYAGAPLIAENGLRIGTLCIIDTEPRQFSADDAGHLRRLAGIAMDVAATHRNDQRYRAQLHTQVSDLERARSQLDQAVDQLQSSNTELRQYASLVSHDLQAPLRHVRGFITLLDETYGGELAPDAVDWIAKIQGAAERMQNLIRDLLGYAKVDGKDVELVPVDLNAVVREAVTCLADDIVFSNDCIQLDGLPRAAGNDRQLVQVFENLIANALKYQSHERVPRVWVTGEQFDGYVQVCVRDNGIGIPADKLDAVFEMFERLHNEHEFPGTGLGLAICKRVLERLGGDIWVESVVGEGSCFYLRLPRAEELKRAG